MSEGNAIARSIAPKPDRENHLLIASGVLAIAMTAGFAGGAYGLWPGSLFYLAFIALFLMVSYAERLGLSQATQRSGLALLVVLSLLIWFVTPLDIVLILTVVIMALAPGVIPRQQTWLLFAGINGAFAAVFFGYWQAENVLGTWLSMLALQAFAVSSSLARVEEGELKQQLFRQNVELQEARSALASKSQLEERLRIAADLHDSVGHQLTALRLQLEALAQTAPEELKPQIANSQQLSRDTLETLRSIVKRMSSDREPPLSVLIEQIDQSTPGVEIALRSELPRMNEELARQLVYCIKEGVSNAIRHGGAKQIDISFTDTELVLEDDGVGLSDGIDPGFGLQNLITRLKPFAGKVELNSRSPRGCRLLITLPTGLGEAEQT